MRPRGNQGHRAIMLAAGDGACLDIVPGGAGEPPAEGALIHFAPRADDVDAIVESVRAAGAKVTMEPETVDIPSDPPKPVRIAFFTGPDGEVIEVFHEIAK